MGVTGFALCAPAALAGDDDRPVVAALEPEAIAADAATLRAVVDPQGRETSFVFQVGTSEAYGHQSAVHQAGKAKAPRAVAVRVTGLDAGTTYHFRVKAWNDEGTAYGPDTTFTTSAAPAAGDPPAPDAQGGGGPGHAATPATPATPGEQGPATPATPATPADPLAPLVGPDLGAPAPQAGGTVVVAPVRGEVKVKDAKGAFRPVDAAAGVPTGAVVDARRGVLELTSAVGDGTQTGRFWGGVFQVRQDEAGMTELVLRGALDCRRSGRAKAAASKRKRRLWGSDSYGKFRTRGRSSVATVRGTKWLTEDRCDGTLTRVTEGAVAVRDLKRKRTVLVKAGRSYLARAAR